MVIQSSLALHALTCSVGSLFIDEAYALAGDEGGDSDTFSKEVIRTLLTEVENNRTGFLVILAGYKDKMGRLMRADPGLPRRFPKQVHLDDYTPAEVAQIAETAATERFRAHFEDGLRDKLVTFIEENYGSQIKQHNGGLAVNLTEEAMGNLAERVMGEGIFGTEAATTLIAADYKIMEKEADELIKLREDVESEIQGLVGMAAGKSLFDDMRQRVQYVENGGSKKVLQVCLNMVITGGHCEVVRDLSFHLVCRESWSRQDHTGPAHRPLSACIWCAAEGLFRGEERAGAEGQVCGSLGAAGAGGCGRRHGWLPVHRRGACL